MNLVRELLAAAVEVHYLSHITGHGLLKLMRPRRELTYTIRSLPDVPEVLAFLAEQADMSPQRRLLDLQHGLPASPSTARRDPETRSRRLRPD